MADRKQGRFFVIDSPQYQYFAIERIKQKDRPPHIRVACYFSTRAKAKRFAGELGFEDLVDCVKEVTVGELVELLRAYVRGEHASRAALDPDLDRGVKGEPILELIER